MKNNILLWIWLKIATHDKNLEAYKLYSRFGSIEKIYSLTYDEIADIEFLSDDIKAALNNKSTNAAQNIIRMCATNKIEIITVNDARYPKQLMEIHNYPCVLFAHGNFEKAFSKPLIAVVGTRECNSYGERAGAKMSAVLAYAGFSIVTGVASGIDTATIKGALSVDGSVVAVLPKGHADVTLGASYKFRDVRKNGVILTEYMPSFKSHRFVYQERNRILAGLSLASVIIQAPIKSGAVMTASYSINQSRDVFVLPGNIDMEQSAGSNRLIKEGATPVISYMDILDHYKPILGDAITTDIPKKLLEQQTLSESKEEEKFEFKRVVLEQLDEYEELVFKLLQSGYVDCNAIYEQTNINTGTIAYALSSLETKGAVKSLPGGKYKIIV